MTFIHYCGVINGSKNNLYSTHIAFVKLRKIPVNGEYCRLINKCKIPLVYVKIKNKRIHCTQLPRVFNHLPMYHVIKDMCVLIFIQHDS